ncbi:hypothetical protein [Novosphingobium sp. KACC 22771]|uniref:hypothetical protein n=1 Tax=Novosphingobium sp. KACC 22771 TaxID=3025670 RepID=UPI0023650DE2|nr:hypothetical protein [Novosphingobium sp. KACC 22771]WDF74527.1 hypothetical protein PQ467_21550 [Novosphingobium sp. KACC 22771]
MIKTALSLLLAAAGPVAPAPPVGDQAVTFMLAPGVESRYRLFVPEDWRPGDHWPLVVMLHGGGANEDGPFDRDPAFRDRLFAAARAHHYILLSPRGHKGGWGAQLLVEGSGLPPRGTYRWPKPGALTGPPPKLAPRSQRDQALAHQDVFAAIGRIRTAYGTLAHPYLMGNSMGGQGTLHLAQDQPRTWCALSPSDGPFDPSSYPYARAKGTRAALFVHGDNDTVAPLESMADMAGRFDRAGIPTRLMIVAGGGHSDSWQRAMPAIFDFFARHPCDK